MNLLSLHQMGDPRYYREAVRELEFMLPTYAQGHQCIVHDAALPLPDYARDLRFHAIVLGPTFLCNRYRPQDLARVRRDYGWIGESDAIKIALPQDDYDCSAILDRWLAEWGVDRVYTVCPEYWDLLYPQLAPRGIIRLGYTGYISERWVRDWANARPLEARSIDVSYRAARLTANFGSVGDLKWRIAETFRATLPPDSGLRVDISTDPRQLVPGMAWHAFLEDSRCCLVTPSGSSLHDPEGVVRARVRDYLLAHPDAPFDDVAAACFPGQDRRYLFTAISPRNIEAALAGTVQLATPGAYSGLMEEGLHYVRLEEDCSNLPDVVRQLRDRAHLNGVRTRARALMLDTRELWFEDHVAELLGFIEEHVAERRVVGSPDAKARRCVARYAAEQVQREGRYWGRRRALEALRRAATRLGVRRVAHTLRRWRADQCILS